MQFSYFVDDHEKLLVTRVTGRTTMEDLFLIARTQVNDPACRPTMKHFVDFRGADYEFLPADLTEQLAIGTDLFVKAYIPPGHKTAVLHDSVTRLANTEMFKSYADDFRKSGMQLKTFMDFDAACQWLEIDPALAQKK
jgi:hypothetical protein